MAKKKKLNIPCVDQTYHIASHIVVNCCLVWFRHESAEFFDQTTLPGNVGLCGNKTASQATAFSAAARKLLVDLQLATPKINGGNSRKKAVILGVVVGGVGLLILIVGFFPYFKLSRKPEAARRDLKSATKNFSEENKLGEGGFGDVYRVKKRLSLNWKQLNDIILGTARGLAYLHEEFHVCITRRDIKTSNILLDDSFQTKIADFGLARLLPHDQTHLSTRLAGTLGYTAPEYEFMANCQKSCQKSSEIKSDAKGEFLLEKAWKLYENGKHVELVDPNEYKPEDVKKIIEIALMCTQPSAAQRPTMSEVVVLLKSTSSLGE
ncbi:cysteine-rich receptor-like protein kinase 2 [Prunus yedoensis var. nudiflora]|uniref:non-specific serine/threonine protein kinase n=1 Tax=Prunus yedoensis var. nudiflora TaxID=2094558 RepID=A0A314V2E1_PRUYE|nr:cysteine-rich receptor-like protein kinase 2 [Prunus yedoensis var. nudiflora]